MSACSAVFMQLLLHAAQDSVPKPSDIVLKFVLRENKVDCKILQAPAQPCCDVGWRTASLPTLAGDATLGGRVHQAYTANNTFVQRQGTQPGVNLENWVPL